MKIKRGEYQEDFKDWMNEIKESECRKKWSENILKIAKTICGTSGGDQKQKTT